ncbi:lysylphosphatidylglycerol synthase transmembrane domain-containing protein [Leptospira sp. 96542]|nr:lysylphosphatidylglycerol synthase transmembrane domain-containing protein [Leptospira sp. 96542]
MKKWLLGVFVSGIALYFLSKNFHLSEFERLRGKINWWILPALFLSNLWAFVPFSKRWFHLLEKRIGFGQSISSSIIGVGLNMVLPARGGDLIRLLMIKKNTEIPLTYLFSRLFLEKVMDLAAVVLVGASALFYMGLGQSKNLNLLYISTLVILAMFIGLCILKFFLNPLRNLIKKMFKIIGKQELFEEKFDHHIIEFSQFLKGHTLFYPVLYSIPTWLCGYAVSYWLAGVLIGLPISFPEALLFMFLGGMGVAIPSAPSGIGVFHAAIISGFIIVGRDPGEGLVYATVVHLTQFIITTSLAVFVYLHSRIISGKTSS